MISLRSKLILDPCKFSFVNFFIYILLTYALYVMVCCVVECVVSLCPDLNHGGLDVDNINLFVPSRSDLKASSCLLVFGIHGKMTFCKTL